MCSPPYFLLETSHKQPPESGPASSGGVVQIAKKFTFYPSSFIRPTARTRKLPPLYHDKLYHALIASSKGADRSPSKHYKRSLHYDKGSSGGSSILFNSNFEFVSNWTLTEEDEISATEMSDEKLRSLGFPVPETTTSTNFAGGGRSMAGSDLDMHIPVIDNPFIQFLSRK